MIYFAYGSNMDGDWMRGRCPSARFLFTARLHGFRLAFTRTSIKQGGGVADIVRDPLGTVWGVVYHIEDDQRPALDRAEGVAIRAYEPFTVDVHPGGDRSQRLKAQTYVVVTKESPTPKPSPPYKTRIVNEAIHWRLPDEYIQGLRAIETQP